MLMPTRIVAATVVSLAAFTAAGLAQQDAADVSSFSTEQKATVGAALLGLTPETLAAAGLTDAQASEVISQANTLQAFDELVALAHEVEQQRADEISLNSNSHRDLSHNCDTQHANANGPSHIRDFATSSVQLSGTGACPPLLASVQGFDTSSRTAAASFLSVLSALFNQTIDPAPALVAHISGPSDRQRDAQGNGQGDGASRPSNPSNGVIAFESLHTRLRTSCMRNLTQQQRSRILACIEAQCDGLDPEYGLKCKSRSQRMCLKGLLQDEEHSLAMGQPMEHRSRSALDRIKNDHEVRKGKSDREQRSDAIRRASRVDDRSRTPRQRER